VYETLGEEEITGAAGIDVGYTPAVEREHIQALLGSGSEK
jgi:hypothetical protein